MTAWVLLWAWGMNSAFAVSGISDKQSCQDLGERMKSAYAIQMATPLYYCYEYRIVK